MPASILQVRSECLPHDPASRGYCVVYREDGVNHCPACGRTHWYIGRISAECSFCATALPLAAATSRGAGMHSGGRGPIAFREAA